jgi:hypothetical protein
MSAPPHLRSRTFARDRRTWIATLAVGAIVWAGTSAWLNRHVGLATPDPAGPADDGRFVTLAYDRIVAMPDGKNLDRLGLRDQLRSLSAAGWQPVTLDDLRRAYAGTRRLPRKPLLLTFDEGYLATYEAADPVLRELHWPAVMFLRTDRQESRDVSFLFWDRLRRMALSGLWEIASGDPVARAEARSPGTLPATPPGAALIAKRLDLAAAPAWAPRGIEPLVALGCAADALSLARNGGPAPWLGFLDDPVGANEPTSSPLRIARLRVDPRWSTHELLHRLEVAVTDPAVTGDGSWVPGEGADLEAGGAVRLSGRPRADIWIPAARWVDDWKLDATVRTGPGEFWIVQPAGFPGREWRFGGAAGLLYLQDRSDGRPPEVLARSEALGEPGSTHAVRIIKRGEGVCVRWDDRPLASAPVALPQRWRGRVGLVAYGGRETASLTVEHLRLASYPYRVQVVSSSPDAAEVATLTASAEEIAALSPPWASVDGATVREAGFDRDLFRMLGRRYAWDIVPTVAVRGDRASESASAAWIRDLPGRVEHERWAGIRLDLRSVPRSAAAAWSTAAQELRDALHRANLRLVVVTS